MNLRWPPVRLVRCLRCSRLLASARAVAVDRWPGGLFCSDACVERMDAGFEVALASVNARRAK